MVGIEVDDSSREPKIKNQVKPGSTRFAVALLLSLTTTVWAQVHPVHTFSIVARDQQTGELGVAVQSHWFAVGNAVPWAEAGVGAVATQSFADPSYGKLGLDLIARCDGAGRIARTTSSRQIVRSAASGDDRYQR